MDKSLVSNHTVNRLSYLMKTSDQQGMKNTFTGPSHNYFHHQFAQFAKAHTDVIKLVVLSNQRN